MAEGSLYERRVAEEWKLLQKLAEQNPGVLEVAARRRLSDGEQFEVTLHQTSGIVGWRGTEAVLERSHRAVFRFPRFFPAVPLEATLARVVFHPNVDPRSGFVCLWTRTSPGDTVLEAVRRLQRIIAWAAVNCDAEHVMQPQAVEWARERKDRTPLDFTPLVELEEFKRDRDYAAPRERRPRLEARPTEE
jgi:ubiquitin-protein ligase